jgi:hypothetical protein
MHGRAENSYRENMTEEDRSKDVRWRIILKWVINCMEGCESLCILFAIRPADELLRSFCSMTAVYVFGLPRTKKPL